MVALETKGRNVTESLRFLYNDLSITINDLDSISAYDLNRFDVNFYDIKKDVDKIYGSIFNYLKYAERFKLDNKHDIYNLKRARYNLEFAKRELGKWNEFLKMFHETGEGNYKKKYSMKFNVIKRHIKKYLKGAENALEELSGYDEEISVLNPSRHFIAILLSFAGLIGLYFTLSYLPIGTTAMFSSSTIFVSPLILILAVLFFLTTLIYFFRK